MRLWREKSCCALERSESGRNRHTAFRMVCVCVCRNSPIKALREECCFQTSTFSWLSGRWWACLPAWPAPLRSQGEKRECLAIARIPAMFFWAFCRSDASSVRDYIYFSLLLAIFRPLKVANHLPLHLKHVHFSTTLPTLFDPCDICSNAEAPYKDMMDLNIMILQKYFLFSCSTWQSIYLALLENAQYFHCLLLHLI